MINVLKKIACNFYWLSLTYIAKLLSIFVYVTGLEDGQSIIVTKLTQSDLTATYSSDASTNFVPYIQDPATSMDMVQRLLYRRQVLIVYVQLTIQIKLYKLIHS